MRYSLRRLGRALRTRVIKRWGSHAAKKRLWDEEFARGQWDYLDSTPSDPIYEFLVRYGRTGGILDLGCGSGNTGCELPYDHYERYTGVDVSEVAVQKAQARSDGQKRSSKNAYFCADIESYVPCEPFRVILFRESLFYIPVSRIRGVLDRYGKFLAEDGVFIVRMCDGVKYKPIEDLIRRHYRVVEEFAVEGCPDVILVFSLRPGGSLA